MCLWHQNQAFISRRQDIFKLCLWQQDQIFGIFTCRVYNNKTDILNMLFRQFRCCFLLVMGSKLGISTETLRHFPATFLATKIGYFEGGVASLDSWLCVWQSFGHFQAVFAAMTLKTLSYVSGNKTRHSQ